MRAAVFALIAASLVACPEPAPPPPPVVRCAVDLAALGLLTTGGSGAGAQQIASAEQLLGGAAAQGEVGDFLLQNDRLRVVIQRPLRTIGPAPFGGAIIDADRQRAPGEAGRDQFGKMAPLYALGRTIDVKHVEVLHDGAAGGSAVIAATGDDALLDYINLSQLVSQFGAGVTLTPDPELPLPLTATTYYVLSPGEPRVRVLSAFCNAGTSPVVMQMGDFIDQGGETDLFNPTGCAKGFLPKGECLIDPMQWFGYQGDDVAYAYRAFRYSAPEQVASSAALYVTGVVAVLAEGEGQAGLLSWIDANAPRRPGAFGVLAGGSRNFLRDFYVGRDLASLSSAMRVADGLPSGRLSVLSVRADGSPAPETRVAVVQVETGKQLTVLTTDGGASGQLLVAPGDYLLSAGRPGHAARPAVAVTVPASGEGSATVTLGDTRSLRVSVKDPFGAPLTARVTVLCQGPCPVTAPSLRPFVGRESVPDDFAGLGYANAAGVVELPLPPGRYQAFVSRGPEYSLWPDTAPAVGALVDVSQADVTLEATLAQVVSSTGWLSADLHVHAAASMDSQVPNALRVMSFAAEGVDVLVSTDHDFVTDYGPLVRELGLSASLGSVVGTEVTPLDYGHHNVFPVERRPGPTGGAFDWAGGVGPTLRLDQLYAEVREAHPEAVIQMNHPRFGSGGALEALQVDTATGATHAPPERFRMVPRPDATAEDTRLFSPDFDSIEVLNGLDDFAPSTPVLNDWMTFLSRGWVKAATGVSDSHAASTELAGYGRTWLRAGSDDLSQFTGLALAQALKARSAVVSSGPFVTLTARRLVAGQPQGEAVGIGGTLSLDGAAGDQVELTVEVQAPEWLQFDAIEVYGHAPGREAVGGVGNTSWQPPVASRAVDLGALPLEAVPGLNGFTARRLHVTERFVVTSAVDTWFVAMVRSSAATRGLFPVAFTVRCDQGRCTSRSPRPGAVTNPVFLDADGSGAYDDFPLKVVRSLTRPLPPPAQVAPRLTEAQQLEVLRGQLQHRHGAP